MVGTIRARCANGVLEPRERPDRPEGEGRTITRRPTAERIGSLERCASGIEEEIGKLFR